MLLDTSGLYCYLDASDGRHEDAVRALNGARVRLTHNYVLAELVALCTARRFDRRIALEFVRELAHDPEIRLVWVDKKLHQRAMDLLFNRQDKSYSLCDAVSFLLMREERIAEALTTDHHFEQDGFVRLLR